MSDATYGKNSSGMHWSFWVIGVVTLIWNVMGCVNFFMQMNPAMLAQMPESQRAVAALRPAWASVAFALAVFGGALGGLLLLLKRSAAYYVFVASLIGMIVTMIQAIDMGGVLARFSPFELVLTVVMPVALAPFLIWYSKYADRKGWIE